MKRDRDMLPLNQRFDAADLRKCRVDGELSEEDAERWSGDSSVAGVCGSERGGCCWMVRYSGGRERGVLIGVVDL